MTAEAGPTGRDVARYIALGRVVTDAAATDNEKAMAKKARRALVARHPSLPVLAAMPKSRRAKDATTATTGGFMDRLMSKVSQWADRRVDDLIDSIDESIDEAIAGVDAVDGDPPDGGRSGRRSSRSISPRSGKERGEPDMPDELYDLLETAPLELEVEEDGDEDEIWIEMTLTGKMLKMAKRAPRVFVNWLFEKYEAADYDDEDGEPGEEGEDEEGEEVEEEDE